jgi:hypothetical protein
VKEVPSNARDPMPFEALLLLTDTLLQEPTLPKVLTAIGLHLSFDLYLRPSEVLNLRRTSVVPPQGRKYPRWAVIIAPFGTENRPSKNKEFDDTVLASPPGADRDYVQRLLETLHKTTKADTCLLDPLNLAVYEKVTREACATLEIEHLALSPHSARHGGPSTDAYNQVLDTKAIMTRGRWKALASVRRYEKKGKLQRQVAKLGPALRRQAAALNHPQRVGGPVTSRLIQEATKLRKYRA